MPYIKYIKNSYFLLIMAELSRLTFGYYLDSTNKYGNLLEPGIGDLRDFLLQVKQTSGIEIATWYSQQGGSQVWKHSAIRIRLEGKLNSVGDGLNRIVEREGVPSFVDKPVLPHGLHHLPLFLIRRVDDEPGTPTTSDAYKLAIGVYNQKNIRTTVEADNTLVRA